MKKKTNQDLRQELEELSPQLRAYKDLLDQKSVPEGYFDSLEAQVLSRIAGEHAGKNPTASSVRVKLFSFAWLRQPALALAASLALILGLAVTWYVMVSKSSGADVFSFQEISSQEAWVYLQDNLHELDEQFLYENLRADASNQNGSLELYDIQPSEAEQFLKENSQDLHDSEFIEIL